MCVQAQQTFFPMPLITWYDADTPTVADAAALDDDAADDDDDDEDDGDGDEHHDIHGSCRSLHFYCRVAGVGSCVMYT